MGTKVNKLFNLLRQRDNWGQQEVTLNSHFFTPTETIKHTKPKNDYFTTTNPLLPMGAQHEIT
jgi:hypothetical protein